MKVSGLTFLKWQNIYKIFSLCHTYQVTSCIKLFFIWFLREISAAGNTGFKLSWQILLLKVIQINIEYHILTPLAPALWFICSILSVLVLFNFEICNLTLHFEHLSLFFLYLHLYFNWGCILLLPNVHSNTSGATIRALFDRQVSLHGQWLPNWLHLKWPFTLRLWCWCLLEPFKLELTNKLYGSLCVTDAKC